MWSSEDPIFALSSGLLPSGVAVVRLSGHGVFDTLRQLIGQDLPAPRQASLRRLKDPRNGQIVDEALVLLFPGPFSAPGILFG